MSEPTSARWVRDAIELSNECEMWPDSRWSNGDILYWVDRATDAEQRVKELEDVVDAGVAAEQRVKELHKPDTVYVLPWKCVNGDCEHDDTECPEEPHQVCRECWNLWTRDGRDDECFYEDQVGWPCATAHAAALVALTGTEVSDE